MGIAPSHCAQIGIGRPEGYRRPEAREGPVVRCMSDVRRFSSGQVVSNVWSALVVQALERGRTSGGSGRPWIRLGSSGCGRPGWAGRPVAVA